MTNDNNNHIQSFENCIESREYRERLSNMKIQLVKCMGITYIIGVIIVVTLILVKNN